MTWLSASLGRLVRTVGGGTPSKENDAFWSGTIPWVSPKDMSGRDIVDAEDHITDAAVEGSATQVVPVGSVLVVVRSGILVRRLPIAIARVPVALNQDMKALLPGGPLIPEFLAYVLEARANYVLSDCVKRGATVHSVDIEKFNQMQVPVPAPSEQRRIVQLLNQADSLLRIRAKADAKGGRILPALFIKMFGDPATNPKGFDLLLLGDPNIGDLDRGRSRHRPRNDPALLGGPHPLIQTGDVARCDGRIRSYSQTYSDLGLSQSQMWPAGTLCITIAANIAETGVLEFDACFPDSVVGFVPGPRATTEYVQGFLQHLQPVIERNAPQAAQKNINLEILRGLPCPLPPRELQDQFSASVREHYSTRRRQIQVRARLELLFANMVTRAFNGILTASWRESHMKELIQEMEQQARYLAVSVPSAAHT
jgi:type I restriction enzyme, S subunit